jgi:hypothetical protein
MLVTVTIHRDADSCYVPVPFDPKAVFGKVRAPVRVTLNGYTYQSTIARMGGVTCIPLRKSHREAARIEGGETLPVLIELDTGPRKIEVPKDLGESLKSTPPAWDRWLGLSYSHQREYVEAVEGARKPETRRRRIEWAVRTIAALPPRRGENGS